MKLIKDLHEGRIVFYWEAENLKISPFLPNMELASEWFVKFHHDAYMGPERRKSTIDRRKLDYTRERYKNALNIPTNPVGRRITDQHITVDEDRSKEKILELMKLSSE